jgi:hypothetical protein
MHSFEDHGDNITCVYGRIEPSATTINNCSISQNVKQFSQSWPPTAARQLSASFAYNSNAQRCHVTRLQFSYTDPACIQPSIQLDKYLHLRADSATNSRQAIFLEILETYPYEGVFYNATALAGLA